MFQNIEDMFFKRIMKICLDIRIGWYSRSKIAKKLKNFVELETLLVECSILSVSGVSSSIKKQGSCEGAFGKKKYLVI